MAHPLDADAEHENVTFKKLDCDRVEVVEKRFYGCRFEHSAFVEAVFRDCRLFDCTFAHCDLSLLRVIGSSFSNTQFEDSKIIGVNWTEAAWPKVGLYDPLSFTSCAISYSTFIGLKLHRLRIVKCTAKEADFAEADLTGADCTGTDFLDSRFLHTNLTDADFTGATNYAIDVQLNTLKQTKFSLPEALSLLRSLDIVLVE